MVGIFPWCFLLLIPHYPAREKPIFSCTKNGRINPRLLGVCWGCFFPYEQVGIFPYVFLWVPFFPHGQEVVFLTVSGWGICWAFLWLFSSLLKSGKHVWIENQVGEETHGFFRCCWVHFDHIRAINNYGNQVAAKGLFLPILIIHFVVETISPQPRILYSVVCAYFSWFELIWKWKLGLTSLINLVWEGTSLTDLGGWFYSLHTLNGIGREGISWGTV